MVLLAPTRSLLLSLLLAPTLLSFQAQSVVNAGVAHSIHVREHSRRAPSIPKSSNSTGDGCSTASSPTFASSSSPFWMESIKHQGISPFNSDPSSYKVFRNVKDYGAVGDGVHDDTAAINLAITDQNRCGNSVCSSSTVSPAVVYFPQGTYLISTSIIPYYYTQLIGDARVPPTLLATPDFNGFGLIDANPYTANGQFFDPTNNFHRSVRNFVFDMTQIPPEGSATGIHWRVAQATSLINLVFEMSPAPDTVHQGVWMEDGSGGFMGDLVFNGGKFGIWAGNQQFTVRNVTVNNAQTAIFSLWNWGWTYQDITINNCQARILSPKYVGFSIATGGTGAQAIIDTVVTNTSVFIQTDVASNGTLAGSIVVDNAKLIEVPVYLNSGPMAQLGARAPASPLTTFAAWGQGNIFEGINPNGVYRQGSIPAPVKASSLLGPDGKIVSRGHPQYADYDISNFVSARDNGAKGDGVTDDTEALQALFDNFSSCKVIFLDAGFYIVSSTLTIPAGTRLVGEAWSVLAGKGPAFQDQTNPQVVFKVGEEGDQGQTEITDVVFTTVGPAAGAIVVEWNVREPDGFQAGAGMWDTHIRLAGSAGTDLQVSNCPISGTDCFAAFMSLHITSQATGYFEGTWVWLADHDLDAPNQDQITVYAGRGILSESQGPVWMIGTAAEHHVLYQYNLVGAQNHYMGLIQTETPYFQPTPTAPAPFSVNPDFKDPSPYSSGASAWALTITSSQNILIFGAGLYSFFENYSQDCSNTLNCQAQIASVVSSSNIGLYSFSTIASTYQLTVNGVALINEAANTDGFASTITVWKSN
ncbi:exo-beta-1,3-glucanase [Gymnopilus junonius]|uniref:Exo-beta-1,3-glucanase n=1 Tax=Gymnopilus junonius TaxID=109634 RepID=A0A9P5NKX2_GYMJU|nr:exo-beta-1,3-glucanase [Gymnopilus junonius]